MAAKTSPQRYRLEQWLDNPRCDKNAASAILNVSLQELAEKLVTQSLEAGEPAAEVVPQIPPLFAFELGKEFEANLMEGDQPNLLERLLLSHGVISSEMTTRFETRNPSGTTEEHLAESKSLLARIAASDDKTAWVISGFKLPAKVLPPESTFEIDLLLAIPTGGGKHNLIVGEVKVYPDKGGRTNPVQIAGARSQAGLYVYVLEGWISQLDGLEALTVDGQGFLVFSNAADGMPKLAALENLREQDRRAEVAIRGITNLFEQPMVQELAQTNNSEAKLKFLSEQADEYREACWGHCPMAEICFRKVVADDRSIVLGGKTEQQLSSLTLSRAVALADGQVKPVGDVEEDLATRFEDARFPEIEGLSWK